MRKVTHEEALKARNILLNGGLTSAEIMACNAVIHAWRFCHMCEHEYITILQKMANCEAPTSCEFQTF